MNKETEATYLAMQANAHMIALAELFHSSGDIRKQLDEALATCTRFMRAHIKGLEVTYDPMFEKHKPDYSAVMFQRRMLLATMYALADVEPLLAPALFHADRAVAEALRHVTDR